MTRRASTLSLALRVSIPLFLSQCVVMQADSLAVQKKQRRGASTAIMAGIHEIRDVTTKHLPTQGGMQTKREVAQALVRIHLTPLFDQLRPQVTKLEPLQKIHLLARFFPNVQGRGNVQKRRLKGYQAAKKRLEHNLLGAINEYLQAERSRGETSRNGPYETIAEATQQFWPKALDRLFDKLILTHAQTYIIGDVTGTKYGDNEALDALFVATESSDSDSWQHIPMEKRRY